MNTTDSLPNPSRPNRPTLADARQEVALWADLSLDRRRGFGAALSGIGRICGVMEPAQEQAVPLTCAHLNTVLFKRAPAAFGWNAQRFGNIISSLRFIMRRMNLHAADVRGADKLSPAWRALRAELPEYRQLALSPFLGFCSLTGIEPAMVTPDTLARFDHWCRNEILCDDPVKRVRETASNWAWAATSIAGWPAVTLTRPGMRDTYTLSLTAYPPSFQQDVEHFLANLAAKDHEDLYHDDLVAGSTGKQSRGRRRRAVRPRTVETRGWQIRTAAGALVQSGESPSR